MAAIPSGSKSMRLMAQLFIMNQDLMPWAACRQGVLRMTNIKWTKNPP
jgi:hypothetical protein